MKNFNKKTLIITSIITLLLITLLVVLLILGNNSIIHKIVCLILGVLFIVIGHYIPKVPYDNLQPMNLPMHLDNKTVWNVFSRIMGVTFMIEGALVLISMFFSPLVTIITIALLFGLLLGLALVPLFSSFFS